MSDEIFFDGRRYISANEAAASADLTRDYIARLCRDGRVAGRRIGKNWYVDHASLKDFLITQEFAKSRRSESLVEERAREYHGSVVADGLRRNAPVAAPLRTLASRAAPAQVSRVISGRADEIKNKLAGAVAAQTRNGHGQAKLLSSMPGGFAHAALTGAHIPVYALTPLTEFLHKVTALALTLMLTFGTYAAVDPAYARFAADSVRENVNAALDSYRAATGGGIREFANRAQSQVASAAENPGSVLASAQAALTENVPNLFARFARGLNSRVNELVYAVAFPLELVGSRGIAQKNTGGSVSVSVAPYTPKRAPASPTSTTRASVAQTIIQNPVVERIMETTRLVATGGITEEILDRKLAALDAKLSSQVFTSSAAQTTNVTNVYAAAASVGRIEHLDELDLTNPTITNAGISGGSISGASVSATALSSSGDTSLATTTVTGDLTVTGNLSLTGASGSLTVASLSSTNATTTNLFATSTTLINATTTNLYASSASFGTASTTNLLFTNATGTNATTTNLFSTLSRFTTGIIDTFTSTLATITGLNVTNSTTTNATSTNAFSTNFVATNATTTNFFSTNASTTNATSTTLFSVLSNFTTSVISTLTAAAATITNLVATTISGTDLTYTNATTTNATSTNSYISNLGAVTASTTDLTFATAVGGNATSTNLFSTTASSTNLYSTNGNIGVLSAGTLSLTGLATFANGFVAQASSTVTGNFTTTRVNAFTGASNFTGLASFTQASTTRFSVFDKAYFGGSATSTFDSAGNLSVAGTLGVTGDTTLSNATTTNLFSTTASSTNLFSTNLNAGPVALGHATTTNLFSTTASSTNLFSTNGNIGVLSAGTLSLVSALNVSGLSTLAGFISTASSTISSGLFSMMGGASTTAFTNSGTTWFTGAGLSSALLSTDQNGKMVATTSIGANFLNGLVSIANGGTNASSFSTGKLIAFDGTSFVSSSTIGNGQLENSSVTVTAGSGLTGGGTVALGGPITP